MVFYSGLTFYGIVLFSLTYVSTHSVVPKALQLFFLSPEKKNLTMSCTYSDIFLASLWSPQNSFRQPRFRTGYESESESEVAQSCLTLCDPVDCSPPGSLVHGIFQAWILEWGAISWKESIWEMNNEVIKLSMGLQLTQTYLNIILYQRQNL